jgi:hypothetical protein
MVNVPLLAGVSSKPNCVAGVDAMIWFKRLAAVSVDDKYWKAPAKGCNASKEANAKKGHQSS